MRRARKTRASCATRTDSRSRLSNLFRGGDTVQNAIGVLGYDFSLYRIVPTGPADYTAANPRPASPEPVGGNRPRCGDEHAQLLRHGRLPDLAIRWITSAVPLNNVECRGWDSDQATRIHPPARQTPARAFRSGCRHHRLERTGELHRRRAAGQHRVWFAGLRLHRYRHHRHRRDQGGYDLPTRCCHPGRRFQTADFG